MHIPNDAMPINTFMTGIVYPATHKQVECKQNHKGEGKVVKENGVKVQHAKQAVRGL